MGFHATKNPGGLFFAALSQRVGYSSEARTVVAFVREALFAVCEAPMKECSRDCNLPSPARALRQSRRARPPAGRSALRPRTLAYRSAFATAALQNPRAAV